jgi:GT2 family glycosyltransferase
MADFVLLSNDIVFTPNWLQPLVNTDNITIPLCNQQVPGSTVKFTTNELMDLQQYLGNEDEFEIIAKNITESQLVFNQPKLISFYCFYLPYNISSKVGLFDEEYQNGGEDIDYRIRAKMNGHEAVIVTTSYVLHFMGKSTWRGGETEDEISERNKKYSKHFISKWGKEMASYYLDFLNI